mmetsp:Transcript_15204/g.31904  ORF Transcript_15204/g.31904 Transcript_15204/m.31904 type:complete len:81 (+) Transcript_15204:2468-2710(+)
MIIGRLGSTATSFPRTSKGKSTISGGTEYKSAVAKGLENEGGIDGLLLMLGVELGLNPSETLTVTLAPSQKETPRTSQAK